MKKTKKKKNIKGSKTISLRVCVLEILLEDYFKDPSGNSLFNGKGSHSNEINTFNEINTVCYQS